MKSEAVASALIALSAAIGIICGVVVLVVSCVNYKQAYVSYLFNGI